MGSSGASSALAAESQSDVLAGTDVVLQTTDGALNSVASNGDVLAGGNVLLQTAELAEASVADIGLGASVSSTGGHLSVIAADGVSLAAGGDLGTAGGSVDVQAAAALQMADGALISSAGGAVRLQAQGGDLTLGEIQAGAGAVALRASGSVVDLETDSSAVDVTAGALLLNAGTAIGSGANHLETTVGTLSARSAAGGMYVSERDALVLDAVSVAVQRVGSSGASSALAAESQSDVVALGASGHIVLQTTDAGDITINADVSSTAGHLMVMAAAGVNVNADLSTGGAGTVLIDAEGAALTQLGTATITATDSSVRLNAATDLVVGNVVATNVSLVADGGSVLNAAGSAKNVTATNLRIEADEAVGAADRHFTTDVSTLSALSRGNGATGFYLTEDDGLSLGSVAVSVMALGDDGTPLEQSDALQSGLRAQGDGNSHLRLLAGDLQVADSTQTVSAPRLLLWLDDGSVGTAQAPLGLEVGQLALRVDTSGQGSAYLRNAGALTIASVDGVAGADVGGSLVLISGTDNTHGLTLAQAVHTGDASRIASAGALQVNADVVSQAALTLVAQGALWSATGVEILAEEDLLLRSVAGAADLSGLATSTAGRLWLQAATDVAVEQLTALAGDVVVQATSGSLTGKTSAVSVRAERLAVQAGQGVGTAAQPLGVSVLDLAVQAGAGGVQLRHVDEGSRVEGLVLGALNGLSVSEVAPASAAGSHSMSLAGITTVDGGDVALTLDSDLVVSAASSVAGALQVNAGRDVLQQARLQVQQGVIVTAGLVSVGADLISGGAVHITATDALGVSAAGRLQTGAASDLQLAVSAGSLELAVGSQAQAGTGGVSIQANSEVRLRGAISSAAGVVAQAGGALLMASGTGDNRTDGTVHANGAVDLRAGTQLTLGRIEATDAAVSLRATGALLDGDASTDIRAGALSITAASVGTEGDALDTEVDSLLLSASGAVYLSETNDLTLDSLAAPGQSVSLSVGGALLDGDAATGIVAQSLRLSAASVGSPADALDTNVASLALTTTGAAYVSEANALTLTSASIGGALGLSTGGDLALGALNAAGQTVRLDVAGGVSDADLGNADDLNLRAAHLVLVSQNGFGSAGQAIKTDLGTLDAQVGSGALVLNNASAVEVIRAEGDGGLQLDSAAGGFVAAQAQTFNQPIDIKAAVVDITERLSGPRINIAPPVPTGDAAVQPLVIGTPVANRTPAQAVVIDRDEVAQLDFEDIVLGSTQVGQQIWLQTDTSRPDEVLRFEGRVRLESSLAGAVRLAGLIEGQGLEINGSGQTTYFDGADMVQSRSVTINDAVVATQDSILELIDNDPATELVLTLNGDITVRAGVTLQLLADQIVFGTYPGAASARVVLEAGATLVLGTLQFTAQESVVFDSDGGRVVWRAAPGTAVSARPMAPDALPADFTPTADDLRNWLDWMAADRDGDAGLQGLTLGDAQATTRVQSADPWNRLNAVPVELRGTEVHLGEAGDAAWVLSQPTVLRASAGSLLLHIGVQAAGNLSLVSNENQVRMDAGTSVSAEAVAVHARNGITVSQIAADRRVDLFSPEGTVQAAAPTETGWQVQAPAVSFFAYGQATRAAQADRVLRVDADALQVSSPTGLVSSGLTTDGGLVYRAADRAQSYVQLRLIDPGTERVLAVRSEIRNEAMQIGAGQSLDEVWAATRTAQTGLSAWEPASRRVSPQTASSVERYLAGPAQVASESQAWASDDSSLDDLAYGWSGQNVPATLSLGMGEPLLRSTGQMVGESHWQIENAV